LRAEEAIEMRKTTLAVLWAAVLALAAGPAAGVAQPPPAPGERGPWVGPPERMARFLGLSEQQQDEVRKAMEERRADHKALREKIEKNREAMQNALEGESPDPAAVGELAIEGHKLHQQQKALRDAQDEAIRSVLTPEQRVRFDAVKALREEGPGRRPEGGPGPRPGRGPGPRE
jgi:Spy/CpxP family protein refolding chaperone